METTADIVIHNGTVVSAETGAGLVISTPSILIPERFAQEIADWD